ncbi:MAG: MerR family transcriptional regulator [Calditrichaeota bacterium]|nr:MAG: MerR family transcriptional regulator [Calditrichota bacterium]
MQNTYPIKAVALKTGLTAHTIRVWERRYQVLTPFRTESNRRLYSDPEIQKLIKLKTAVAAGHTISHLAKMSLAELTDLVEKLPYTMYMMKNDIEFPSNASVEEFLNQALAAVEKLQHQKLEGILQSAANRFNVSVFIDDLIMPFLEQIGGRWAGGEWRIAQEHGASAALRSILGRYLSSFQPSPDGPVLIAATLVGLKHEFGVLAAAITAASLGWRAEFLGVELPVDEILYAAVRLNAGAVAISILYPSDDQAVREQLIRLDHELSPEVRLFIGGQAAASYQNDIAGCRMLFLQTMADLRRELQ